MRFSSKVDWWVGALLALLPLASLAGAGIAAAAGQVVTGALTLLPVAAIYGGLLFPLYYELADDALVVRFGLVRLRVPYADIRGAEPTRNPLSSPALSLDRLRIDYRSTSVMISPDDRTAFVGALAAKTPHLRRDGDTLRA